MEYNRQLAMVKSVAKNIRSKERKEAPQEKIRSKMYEVLKVVGKSLDEVKKEDLSEKQYKVIIEFIEVVQGFPISLYPNLQ